LKSNKQNIEKEDESDVFGRNIANELRQIKNLPKGISIIQYLMRKVICFTTPAMHFRRPLRLIRCICLPSLTTLKSIAGVVKHITLRIKYCIIDIPFGKSQHNRVLNLAKFAQVSYRLLGKFEEQ
jgi:hypothetical protein